MIIEGNASKRWRTGAAVAILLGSAQAARRPEVGHIEERTFRYLNRGVGWAESPIWAAMQMGNGLSAVVVPVGLRLRGRSWPDAARSGLAAAGAWQLAKVAKALVRRDRPAALLDRVVLRDGHPTGRGFVSGHAAVALSRASALSPSVERWQRLGLMAGAATVGLARIHVGAHLPLDVVGAFALASIWGPTCAAAAVTS